jgi:polyhydroxyalkanoate synthase subunit PhaC
MEKPEDWLAGATFTQASWWPRWKDWLAERSGAQVPAREARNVLCPAPGTYVVAVPAA